MVREKQPRSETSDGFSQLWKAGEKIASKFPEGTYTSHEAKFDHVGIGRGREIDWVKASTFDGAIPSYMPTHAIEFQFTALNSGPKKKYLKIFKEDGKDVIRSNFFMEQPTTSSKDPNVIFLAAQRDDKIDLNDIKIGQLVDMVGSYTASIRKLSKNEPAANPWFDKKGEQFSVTTAIKNIVDTLAHNEKTQKVTQTTQWVDGTYPMTLCMNEKNGNQNILLRRDMGLEADNTVFYRRIDEWNYYSQGLNPSYRSVRTMHESDIFLVDTTKTAKELAMGALPIDGIKLIEDKYSLDPLEYQDWLSVGRNLIMQKSL